MALTGLGSRLTGSDWRPEPGDYVAASAPHRRAVYDQHEFVEGEIEREAAAAGLQVAFHARTAQGVAILTPPAAGA